MQPEVARELAGFYITQGILGVTSLVLAWTVVHLYRVRDADRDKHKVELAAKDALIEELHDDILKEARVGFELAATTKSTLDALLVSSRPRGSL